MTKRFGALALAAALPLTVLAGTSASAVSAPPGDRPCRGEYSNGKAFRATAGGAQRTNRGDFALSNKAGNGRRGETAMRIPRGAQIVMTGRLSQDTGLNNQKPCPGERMSLNVRKAGQTSYVVANRNVITNGVGLVSHVMTVDRDLRFFSNFNLDANTPGARSGNVLVQTRP